MDAFQSFIDRAQCAVQPAVHPIQRIVQLPRPGPGRDPLPQPPCAAQCVRRVGIDAGADAGQQRGAEGGTLLHRRNLDLRAQHVGLDLEPRGVFRAAADGYHPAGAAALQQLLHAAAQLKRHALIHGLPEIRVGMAGLKAHERTFGDGIALR